MRPPTSFPFGILIGGEELHNNHHTFATSAKLSSQVVRVRHRLGYIRVLEMVGLAKVKKTRRSRSSPRQAGCRPRHAAVGDRQPLRRDGQVCQVGQARLAKEVEHLKHKAELESRFLKSSRKLLQREPAKLEASQKQQLVELFQHSKALETMHQMRVELGAIWERSHFDPRPAAASAAGLVRTRRSVGHQVAAGVFAAPAQLRISKINQTNYLILVSL
jgi:stearoyl-CoA desaturase (delta-9 desaturase)